MSTTTRWPSLRPGRPERSTTEDRKSTRLNSSHVAISYAVFCLKKKNARYEKGCVEEARYQTRGCTASIAAGSALTEWMIGKTRAELVALNPAVTEQIHDGLQPDAHHI